MMYSYKIRNKIPESKREILRINSELALHIYEKILFNYEKSLF